MRNVLLLHLLNASSKRIGRRQRPLIAPASSRLATSSHFSCRKMSSVSDPKTPAVGGTTRDCPSTREELLAKSWTIVASRYEESFVSRFAAWTDDALAALAEAVQDSSHRTNEDEDDGEPPKGLVLCCGPGQELIPVAKILGPRANILGIDLAPGMVELAQKRIELDDIFRNNIGSLSVQVGDAMKPPAGPYYAIFSAFGLQQLPKPVEAVKEWIKVLEPRGILVVIYWPPDAPDIPGENDPGPFEVWSDLLNKKLGKNNSTKEDIPWDAHIAKECAEAGADVLKDEYIVHTITFDDARDLFDRMSRAGPWHAMRLRRGDEFVDDLGKKLEEAYPAKQKLTHSFTARILVLQRQQKNSDEVAAKL